MTAMGSYNLTLIENTVHTRGSVHQIDTSQTALSSEQTNPGLRSRLKLVKSGPIAEHRPTVSEQEMGAQVLRESIAREAAYLDGLSDAISVIEDSAGPDAIKPSEPVLKALLKERRGCFAAGIGLSMILAGFAIAAAEAGFLAIAYVQLGALAVGFLAVLFAKDPFKLNAASSARETAAWRRLVEMRLAALDENVRARSEIVDQLTNSASTAQKEQI